MDVILQKLIALDDQVAVYGLSFEDCIRLEYLLLKTGIDNDALKNCNTLGVSGTFIFKKTIDEAMQTLSKELYPDEFLF